MKTYYFNCLDFLKHISEEQPYTCTKATNYLDNGELLHGDITLKVTKEIKQNNIEFNFQLHKQSDNQFIFGFSKYLTKEEYELFLKNQGEMYFYKHTDSVNHKLIFELLEHISETTFIERNPVKYHLDFETLFLLLSEKYDSETIINIFDKIYNIDIKEYTNMFNGLKNTSNPFVQTIYKATLDNEIRCVNDTYLNAIANLDRKQDFLIYSYLYLLLHKEFLENNQELLQEKEFLSNLDCDCCLDKKLFDLLNN